MSQRGFAPILIILLVTGVLVAAGGAYYFGFDHGFEKSASQTPQVLSPTPTVPESTSSADMSYWKTYNNEILKLTLKYPNNWLLSPLPNGVFIELKSPDYKDDGIPRATETIVVQGLALYIPIKTDARGKSFAEVSEGAIIGGGDVSGSKKISNIKRFTVDKHRLLQYDYEVTSLPDSKGTIIQIEVEDKGVYSMEMQYASRSSKEVFNQILSTFKFTQ